MNTCGGSIRVMYPFFQTGEGGSIPTPPLSAKQLWIEKTTFRLAKELNRLWHSRMPRFGTGSCKNQRLPSFAATSGDLIYAVAIWSKPAARELPQDNWLELRRMATAPDAPHNTCSRMLRIMELLIRKEWPDVVMLISYQDTESHTGGIYKAAGWKEATLGGGHEWDCESRPRPKAQSNALKRRWEKHLVPAQH